MIRRRRRTLVVVGGVLLSIAYLVGLDVIDGRVLVLTLAGLAMWFAAWLLRPLDALDELAAHYAASRWR